MLPHEMARIGHRAGTATRCRMPTVIPPLPELVLYTRAGCGLCAEARQMITLVLADRARRSLAVPALVERDIESDPELNRRLFDRIPVVELGQGRLELATSIARLRRLFEDVLDAPGRAEPAVASPGP